MTGDWDLAEDCAQDAFAQALHSWPADGVPRRPGAWLTTLALHRDALELAATHAERRFLSRRLEELGEPA